MHFSSLIPRMSTSTLAISCLTTSNLPWFMDLSFQVPVQYCSLQHWTLLLSTQSHHNWVLILLCLHPFILSGVISPLISCSILGTYWPGELLFQYLIILPFHTVHGVLKARILKWFAFPSPVDHILSELSNMTHPSLTLKQIKPKAPIPVNLEIPNFFTTGLQTRWISSHILFIINA